MKVNWKKSSPELVARFESAVPDAPGVEARQMFGYPVAFVNGNMFMGLHQEDMFLRLGDPDRAKAMQLDGSRAFSPLPGREMKDYMVIAASVVARPGELRKWVARALAHSSALPPKVKPSKPSKPAAQKIAAKATRSKKV